MGKKNVPKGLRAGSLVRASCTFNTDESREKFRQKLRKEKLQMLNEEDRTCALPPSAFVHCPDPAAEITSYLRLGSRIAAQHLPHLQKLGITHVLNVADDVDCFFPNHLRYLHCKIVDGGEDERIVGVFKDAAAFVRRASEEGGRVFVHCYHGTNRSATVAMAILMRPKGWSL